MSLGGSLAAEERRRVLLDLLRESGRVDISGAAGQLGVHHMTIRRDLKGLEREGSARLVRGGGGATGGPAGQRGAPHIPTRPALRALDRGGGARLVRGGAIFVGTEE